MLTIIWKEMRRTKSDGWFVTLEEGADDVSVGKGRFCCGLFVDCQTFVFWNFSDLILEWLILIIEWLKLVGNWSPLRKLMEIIVTICEGLSEKIVPIAWELLKKIVLIVWEIEMWFLLNTSWNWIIREEIVWGFLVCELGLGGEFENVGFFMYLMLSSSSMNRIACSWELVTNCVQNVNIILIKLKWSFMGCLSQI